MVQQLPTPGRDDRALFEAHAKQEIEPSITSRVDEELELRVERDLVVGSVHGDFHAAGGREGNLQATNGVLGIRQCDLITGPAPPASAIVDRDIDCGRQLLHQDVEKVDRPLGVGNDVRRVVIRLLDERETVQPRPKSAPYGGFRLTPTKKPHD